MDILFEFNTEKSETNKLKHGIDFQEAQKLWNSNHLVLPTQYVDEQRFILIGRIGYKFYTAVYTERVKKVRIISCRRSRENEKRWYYENQNKD